MRDVFAVALTTTLLLGCGDDDGTFQPGGRELVQGTGQLQ